MNKYFLQTFLFETDDECHSQAKKKNKAGQRATF